MPNKKMTEEKQERKPTDWKDAVVKWMGLFPVLLVIACTTKMLGVKPLPLKLFIESLIIVPLLHYIVTPFMERTFSGWIYDDESKEAKREG